ncbi:hypothetical protein ACWCOW_29530 [Streptomyces sp. NPDC001939]
MKWISIQPTPTPADPTPVRPHLGTGRRPGRRTPEGTTVTGKPAGCGEAGPGPYTCRTPILLWEKARSTFDITLRVDRVVDGGAKGSVATRHDNPDLRISAFGPRPADNTAEFTISGS